MNKKTKPVTTSEWDFTRAKQAAEKAAELKAKLDMVSIQNKPSYGRQHRKIGEMICNVGVKRTHGYQETAKFVLRLNEKDGLFIAEHGDFWYVSKSRDALQAKMDEVARITLDIVWTRYIRVEYETCVPSNSTWHNGTTTLDVDDDRSDRTVLGIKLSWEVVEYSGAFHLPGDGGERYMTRAVDEDGDPSDKQETVGKLPSGLVPYTNEREELLKSIRDAFTSIDAKMVKLLRGTPDEVAKRLDAVQGPLLLGVPEKKRKS